MRGLLQGSSDSPLTERGLNQAIRCGQRLRKSKFAAAYTSPLKRARKTAELLLCGLEDPPQLKEEIRLRERSFGEWEGLPWKTIETRYANEIDRYGSDASFAMRGGESRQETLDRALEFLAELAQTHGEDESVLLVTHSATATSIIKEVRPAHHGTAFCSRWRKASSWPDLDTGAWAAAGAATQLRCAQSWHQYSQIRPRQWLLATRSAQRYGASRCRF